MQDMIKIGKHLALTDFVVRHVELRRDPSKIDALIIQFTNGMSLYIEDTGQNCCEVRSMTCDDDLEGLAGSRLLRIETRHGGWGHSDVESTDEMAFVLIQFSTYAITLTSHNEHNGYYGGFDLRATLKTAEGKNVGKVQMPASEG